MPADSSFRAPQAALERVEHDLRHRGMKYVWALLHPTPLFSHTLQVLAIATRNHYKPSFYLLLVEDVIRLVGEAFVEGWKNIERVQAFILGLATFPAPSRWREENRTWMHLGFLFPSVLDARWMRAGVSGAAKTGKPIIVHEDATKGVLEIADEFTKEIEDSQFYFENRFQSSGPFNVSDRFPDCLPKSLTAGTLGACTAPTSDIKANLIARHLALL
ncbi:hypothetical protein FRC10_011548 [Ceratobasidium sp. 414]|nr:hypothetical protein FRC10_011548 [Ceratobasidium sp. 414]